MKLFKKKPSNINHIANNNHYTYLQALILSFYSPKIYIDVAKRWRGLGFIYLFFLSMILSVPMAIQMTTQINQYFKYFVEPSQAGVPDLSIDHGKISLLDAEHHPHEKWLGRDADQQPFLLIDTSKTMEAQNKLMIPLIIAQNGVRIQVGSFTSQEKLGNFLIAMSPNVDLIITGEQYRQMMTQLKQILAYSTSYLMIFVTWSMAISMLFLLAFFTQFASYAALGYKIKWIQTLRLLSVAGTPILAVSMILFYLNGFHRPQMLLLGLLFFGYYLFGVRACKADLSPMIQPLY